MSLWPWIFITVPWVILVLVFLIVAILRICWVRYNEALELRALNGDSVESGNGTGNVAFGQGIEMIQLVIQPPTPDEDASMETSF